MLDLDTFLTTLYVLADDFCKTLPPPPPQPGPTPSLTAPEVLTLALFSQWRHFASERAFYRFASRHLRAAFPTLPHRTQLNRLVRAHHRTLVAFFHHLVALLVDQRPAYEVLDSTALPVRNVRRRGRSWLVGYGDIGWSTQHGWYAGFRLLSATTPTGILTGFGVGPASANDRRLAETFFALRLQPDPLVPSVGRHAPRYLADTNFVGAAWQPRWQTAYHALVLAPPEHGHPQAWPKGLRRWMAGRRQIVESWHAKLTGAFRLLADRAHTLAGLLSRVAATAALHNACIWLNRRLGRPYLAFADLLDW